MLPKLPSSVGRAGFEEDGAFALEHAANVTRELEVDEQDASGDATHEEDVVAEVQSRRPAIDEVLKRGRAHVEALTEGNTLQQHGIAMLQELSEDFGDYLPKPLPVADELWVSWAWRRSISSTRSI